MWFPRLVAATITEIPSAAKRQYAIILQYVFLAKCQLFFEMLDFKYLEECYVQRADGRRAF